MIAIDPAARPTFDTLLQTSRNTVFPEAFYSFFHNYVSTVNELSLPSPYAYTAGYSATPIPASGPSSKPSTQAANVPEGDIFSEPLPSDSDHRMEKIWADYESVEPYLVAEISEEPSMEAKIENLPSGALSRPFQVIISPNDRIVLIDVNMYFIGYITHRAIDP